MSGDYVELHAKSFYSFGLGASHVHELLAQAAEYGCDSLALTDANLCGALDFARQANGLGITSHHRRRAYPDRRLQADAAGPDAGRVTATFPAFSAWPMPQTVGNPRLDPGRFLPRHAGGVVLLTGGRNGPLSALMAAATPPDRTPRPCASCATGWTGTATTAVYVELQQNFTAGRRRAQPGPDKRWPRQAGALVVVATNDVHYHVPERYRLQHALVAASHNTTIDQALRYFLPNHHLCLKPPGGDGAALPPLPRGRDRQHPAHRRDVPVRSQRRPGLHPAGTPKCPRGYTTDSYLQRLCYEAASATLRLGDPARWRSGSGKSSGSSSCTTAGRVPAALPRNRASSPRKSWRRSGLAHPETPAGGTPARAVVVAPQWPCWWVTSSASATLTPSEWGLTLERFISEDTTLLPDIDLDFPRQLRDELIPPRPPAASGPEFAVLAGAVSTYSVKGIIQDIGQGPGTAQGRACPSCPSNSIPTMPPRWSSRCGSLPAFRDRVDAPGWRDLAGPGSPAHARAPQSLGPARGWPGAQQFSHTGNGAHQGRGYGGPLHHGLEQGQRGRRRFRQDRPAIPAGAGPDRGGPGPHRGARGSAPRPIPYRPQEDSAGVRPDQPGPGQGRLPAPVARPAQDGSAAQLPQSAWTWPTRWPSSAPAWGCRAAPYPSSWSATATARSGTTTTIWRKRALKRAATASSSGRSRWCN